jgi:hypothetical protein
MPFIKLRLIFEVRTTPIELIKVVKRFIKN